MENIQKTFKRFKKYLDQKERSVLRWIKKNPLKNWLFVLGGAAVVIFGIVAIWVSTLHLPDFNSISVMKMQSSIKIYDRTGKVLLFDVHQDVKRTIIPYENMGVNIKNATVAIEDSDFYKHSGIRITSIIRGTVWAVLTGKKIQGGSTITQQLVKNTLLTQQRTLSRKVKEWILALKLERVMSKEDILAGYLNEAPYGGNVYGIEEASKMFFGKEPANLSIAESAYLAAIPNGPTYYSPYGKNRAGLEERKNLVLKRMLTLKFITNDQYQQAMSEAVNFLPTQPSHIVAPHFVFFVKDYLEKKYGPEAMDAGGLTVTTTLDADLQKKAQDIALVNAKNNEKNWDGKNAAVVVIDPKTGQILAMVGSRDYFDKTVDGNFNVATASRQPGSSFKPIVYAEAFQKGYTKDTTLFDVKTEFNASCSPTGKPLPGHAATKCYMPDDYDNKTRGPMTLKDALAQSINIVAVKLLYLVGIPDSLKMAHDLGITTLNDPTRYGLSLVIGGGETTLLDMTSVYGVFAAEGVRHPYQSVLSVVDSGGNTLEQYQDTSYQVLEPNIPRTLSNILSDNIARTPTFGANSALVVPGREVAVKTGTTNNNKDAWTIGYTPSVVVGVWVGNNDNKAMKKGGAALAGPIWNQVITEALKNLPVESFNQPDPIDPTLPPILRGFWKGGDTFVTDSMSNGLATDLTPVDTKTEQSITNVHTILFWIDKANPLGPKPTNPEKDPQYTNWEYGVQKWWAANQGNYQFISESDRPTNYDSTHTATTKPVFNISGISDIPYKKNQQVSFSINPISSNPISRIDIFVNDIYTHSLKSPPYTTSFTPSSIDNIGSNNTIHVVGYDSLGNTGESVVSFAVQN